MRRGLLWAPTLVVMLGGASGTPACEFSGYDPALVSAWADGIDDYLRGPMDIAHPELGLASHGLPEDVLGSASGDRTCSLGDGGHLTVYLSAGVSDGPGDDLVVYENGFWNLEGLFAELAFVEVSSNGEDFARFPSGTERITPVGAFGSIDPCDYSGLAGDRPALEGTGFDLADLADHARVVAGDVDLSQISYVRVVDVVGDGSTEDSAGAALYDPYPTLFDTGGFDLDAIGVLHLPEPSQALSLLAGLTLLLAWTRHGPGKRACRRRA